MRPTTTLISGLMRDPALLLASLILAAGLALVAIASLAMTWRARPRGSDGLIEQPAL